MSGSAAKTSSATSTGVISCWLFLLKSAFSQSSIQQQDTDDNHSSLRGIFGGRNGHPRSLAALPAGMNLRCDEYSFSSTRSGSIQGRMQCG
eukprot:660788-Rhodomonas_salina.1